LRLASGFSDFKFLVLSASFHFIPKRSELKWPAENSCYSSSKDMKTHFQPKNILQVNSLGKHTKVSWWLQHI
jgi:hypothetical protein